MADVFISYSRKDIDFVHRVFDVLTARERDPGLNGRMLLLLLIG